MHSSICIHRDRDDYTTSHPILAPLTLQVEEIPTHNARHHSETALTKFHITIGYIMLETILEIATTNASVIFIVMFHMNFLFHLYRIQWQNMPSFSFVNTSILPTMTIMPTTEQKEKMSLPHCSKWDMLQMNLWKSFDILGLKENSNNQQKHDLALTVDFVKYMLWKPIRHGIKVFVICCSLTGVLLWFEIYFVKKTAASAVALAIVKNLIIETGLMSIWGCICCTNKLSWQNEYYVQYTMWKDWKQVKFIHTTGISSCRGMQILCRSKGSFREG